MARRSFGIKPTTAAKQLMKSWPPKVPLQPLPPGSPGTVKPDALGIKDKDPLRFFVIGDHGGIKDPSLQNHVTVAMEAQKAPDLVYSVGDVVYFCGNSSEYDPQFYEAYAHLAVPFVAIPGNHDGSPDPAAPGASGISTFLANFCDTKPSAPPADQQLEFGRHTQTQPYVDWTLDAAAVTVIGVWTNVPSGGHLEPKQVNRVTQQLSAAKKGKPVVVALHHPPFSVDAHHGGSKKMVDALTKAMQASGRYADLILSGHVHNYQRFTWTLDGRKIPTVVIGNSGYHNLHLLAKGATPGTELAPGVVFEAGDDAAGGFLEIKATADKLTGAYHSVNKQDGTVTLGKDSF